MKEKRGFIDIPEYKLNFASDDDFEYFINLLATSKFVPMFVISKLYPNLVLEEFKKTWHELFITYPEIDTEGCTLLGLYLDSGDNDGDRRGTEVLNSDALITFLSFVSEGFLSKLEAFIDSRDLSITYH